jgi:2-keto-3-deoxy-L-rhamnonate aldolase RhmA
MRYDEVEKMVAACPRVGATPILRIPDALEANVQKAMDIGMLGIIVPTVDDALEARESARFARFPPVRGAAPAAARRRDVDGSCSRARTSGTRSTTTCSSS